MGTTPTPELKPQASDEIEKPVSEDNSWPYWAVPRVRTYRLFLIVATVVCAGILYAAVASLNPSLPLSPGSNTVDHLTDPHPGSDYSDAALTAIALSANHLAIGTEHAGLILLPVRGVFPRRVLTDAPVVDVAEGLDSNTFLVLQRTQRLSKVDASGWFPGAVPLLDSPARPIWPGITPFTAESVILAKLDERGLLLVVRNGGIARYLMSPSGRNRRRSWETQPMIASAKVEYAVLTGDGLWLSTEDGRTLFARLDTLADLPARALNSGRLTRLDAGRDGSWASAVGAAGHVWLHSDGTWAGPWFASPQKPERLRRAADVLRVRRSHGVLWLATAADVFAYHESSKTMRLLLEDIASAEIESVPDGTLLATGKGLYLQPASRSDPTVTEKLDSAAVSQLRTSPSGDTTAYKARPQNEPEIYRAAVRPFSNTVNVSAGVGWHAPGLRLIGVAPLGSQAIFGTSHGCLLYDASAPSYVDCSKISPVAGRPERTTGPFSSLEGGDGAILAVAGGTPLVYQSAGRNWLRLDPEGRVQYRQLTSAGGSIYGLGVQGSLFRFNTGARITELLSGRAPSLTATNDFLGDATGDAGNWHMALLSSSHWVYYSSSNGAIEERPLPASQIRQIRIHNDEPLLLLADGSVLRRDGQTIFGRGHLPFAPEQATRVAQGANDTVLVGGASGQSARYSWPSGTWDSLPPLPSREAVTRLQEDSGSVWVKAGNAVFRLGGGGGWRVQNGYAAWLVEKPGERTWLAGPAGVALETVSQGRANSTVYATGSGIRQFLPEVKYAWQIDMDRVALFGGSSIGVFGRHTDRWETVQGATSQASVFLPSKGHLIVKDGPVVRRFSSDLKNSDLLQARGDVSIHVSGDRLEALVHNGELVSLSVWNDVSKNDSKTYNLIDEKTLDGVIAADGRIWALRQEELVQLQISGNGLVVKGLRMVVPPDIATLDSLIVGNNRYRFLAPQQSLPTRAALQYGLTWLDWSVTSTGATVAWRGRSDLPVWCTSGDRLAVQCVHDLTRDGDTILLATEFGVIRRSLTTYELKGAEPNPRRTGFSDPSGTAVSGSLSFSIGGGGLIVTGAGADRRSWDRSVDGWRLRDDNASWIGRNSQGNLVLRTAAGSWAWAPSEGRRGLSVAQSDRDYSLDTPALRVRYSGGRVSLEAFDRRSPFDNGRLFVDSIGSIRGHSGSLYTLMAGRCVIRRDASNPERITGAWSLPAFVSGTLERGERGVRFVSGAGVWELIAQGSGALWARATSDFTEAVTGLVTWRRGVGGGSGVEPYLGAALLGGWWSVDRFSWDRVLAVGALDKGVIVLVTPIGPMVRRISGSGSVPAALWLQPGLISCTPAREGGRVVGMLLGDHLLMETAPDGTLRLRAAPSDLDLTPHLVLDSVNDPSTGRKIAFREVWRARGTGLPLESRVPALPSDRLLKNGRFSFDYMATAGRLSADLWAASVGCDSDFCLGAVYQRAGETLHLRDLVRLPAPIDSIRGSSTGALFGRADHNLFALREENGALRVDRTGDTGDAFYEGDSVSLQLPSFLWKARSRYQTASRALSVAPVGFPLMKAHDGGVAFSFDILRSVAAVPGWRKVALASEGGVFLCTEPNGMLDLSTEGGCTLSFGNDSIRLDGVSRVRVSQGKLWAAYGDGRLAVSADETDWKSAAGPAPWQEMETISGKLQMEANGINIGGRTFTKSNDAWGIGVRPLEGIIEMVYDPKTRFAWVASRNQGVFKLRLTHLGVESTGR